MNRIGSYFHHSTVYSLLSLAVLIFGPVLSLQAQLDLRPAAQPLPGTDVKLLLQLARQFQLEDSTQRAEAHRLARLYNWPIREDGMELDHVDALGFPVYLSTDNFIAARTIGTDRVHPGGDLKLDLEGSGMLIGMWEGGSPRFTHREFGGRVRAADNSNFNDCNTFSYHATHVSGTLIASGVTSNAKGMAPKANVDAYDWTNDDAEMADAASRNLLISNHSYGTIAGWHYSVESNVWRWYGNTAVSPNEDYNFGFYDNQARNWDRIALAAPYYLIVKSAGNDRSDSQPSGEYQIYNNTTRQWENSTQQRNGDGQFDCISTYGTAKNILTVGAVGDIPGGYTSPNDVRITSFSSFGPTDDGRIKPDVVANGDGLNSSVCDNDQAYERQSGTSMSGPSTAGSLILLQELHAKINGGQYMKSATLKALTIHTADESGDAPGPDYSYGWGLVNIGKAAGHIINNGSDRHIREEALFDGVPYSLKMQAVGSGEPLIATIYWHDMPGAASSPALNNRSPKLVNDLDLFVSQGFTLYEPWILDPENPSAAARNGNNRLDNVEQIVIEGAEGEYNLTVRHKSELANRLQEFTIVISGASLFDGSCAQFSLVTGTDGAFTDGSNVDAAFAGGSNCCWLIEPEEASRIRLNFSRLQLGNNNVDSIFVYDGDGPDKALLATLTQNNFTDTLVSSGSSLLVCFRASEANADSAKGWTANYEPVPFCSDLEILTEASGSFNDGSGSAADYLNNTTCSWLIQPPGSKIRFWMRQVATEANRDFIRVYDGPTVASTQLAIYSGTRTATSDTVVSTGASLLVVFESDAVVRRPGFIAGYNTFPVSRFDSMEPYEDLFLWPNPTHSQSQLSFFSHRPETAEMRVLDALGREMYRQSIEIGYGRQELSVPVQGFAPGIYMVELAGQRTGRVRLVVQ